MDLLWVSCKGRWRFGGLSHGGPKHLYGLLSEVFDSEHGVGAFLSAVISKSFEAAVGVGGGGVVPNRRRALTRVQRSLEFMEGPRGDFSWKVNSKACEDEDAPWASVDSGGIAESRRVFLGPRDFVEKP